MTTGSGSSDETGSVAEPLRDARRYRVVVRNEGGEKPFGVVALDGAETPECIGQSWIVKIADAPKLDRFLRAFGAVEALSSDSIRCSSSLTRASGALAVGDRVGPALLFGLGAAFEVAFLLFQLLDPLFQPGASEQPVDHTESATPAT